MTLKFVDDYINRKMEENENFIVFTFYDIRVKNNLSEEDTAQLLELTQIRLENTGYQVYFTGQEFCYQRQIRKVTENELMVAIKNHDENFN